ncbi:MAG: DUF1573 domain-containing protein [Bacteroidales bacterium]|nr:DUF1573 domain-containing protein [Bacteroidales bacterium]
MKKIITGLLVLLFTGNLIPGVMAQQKQATISFDKLIHDFGTFKEEDGNVTCTFSFTNTGSVPLVINRVSASCGCTSPAWSKEPVIPGGKGFVNATYNPKNRPGKFSKSLTVFSNAAKRAVVLTIKGEAIPRERTIADIYPYQIGDIRFKSNHLAFVRINHGEQKTIQMQIINTSKKNQTIRFDQVPKHLQIKTVPETLKPQQEGYIEAAYNADLINDWGFVINRIKVLANDQAIGNNQLTVSATIVEDFTSMTAEELAIAAKIEFEDGRTYDFGKMAQRSKVEHDFVFKNVGKGDLILRKIKSGCGCTVVSPKDKVIEPGKSSSIKAIFSSGTRKGRQNKSITVITNDPKNSRIILRIAGEVNQPETE